MLAWKAVLSDYLDPDDDRRGEARDELREANSRVDADLLKAYQHFAFLTRTEQVEVDWQRFDDDTKSTLKGSHVWDALVNRGRAVNPGRLSGDYLKTLLGRIPRTLTLKEVGQQFYKNAGFPIVASVEDIRRAIYQTLTPPDTYEIVDGNGEVQNISSIDDLSIGHCPKDKVVRCSLVRVWGLLITVGPRSGRHGRRDDECEEAPGRTRVL
jgi:hypothetical protein